MTQKLTLRIVPEDEWPEADRAAWAAALRPGDPLDDPGPLAGRSPEQLYQVRAAYGRWLGFLAESDPEAPVASGLDRFTRARVAPFVGRLAAVLAPCSVRAYLTSLLTAARAMAPDRAFDVLLGATRHIWRTARPVTDKRGRLVASRNLYELGIALMAGAEQRSTPLREAAAFRDGLMIALLAARPVRRRNLASIEIDRHLERRGDLHWLVFPGHEVKNRRPLEFPLPRALTGPMEHYLARYRPFLAARDGHWKREPGTALWVSEDGAPLGAKRIHERICDRTRARFGHSINPHLFRDAAATSIAIEDPEHVGIVLTILGHSTMLTSEAHYNLATALDCARRYHAVLEEYR